MKRIIGVISAVALAFLGSPGSAQEIVAPTKEPATLPKDLPMAPETQSGGMPLDMPEKPQRHLRFWGDAEMLIWWTKAQKIPALAVAGSPPSVVIGDQKAEAEEQLGGRFSAGFWINDYVGLEGGYFFLGDRGQRFLADNSSTPGLARPFVSLQEGVDPITGNPLPLITNVTSLPIDSMKVEVFNRLQGANVDVAWNLATSERCQLTLLTGFRFVKLEDGLDIAAVSPDKQTTVLDSFHTRNDFYGGGIGLRADTSWRRWHLSSLIKLTIGGNEEQVRVSGLTLAGGKPVLPSNGFLAQSLPTSDLVLTTNVPGDGRGAFAFMPEVNVNLGYQITQHWRVFGGYSVLYLTECLRAGDQIDPGINQTLSTPTPLTQVALPRPTLPLSKSDYWAQGASFGIEVRY